MKNATIQEKLINNYSNLDLKALPQELRKNGFDYKLINRSPGKCIYAQWHDGDIVAYEVFKTKIVKYRERMMDFNQRHSLEVNPLNYKEYKETFPNDEEFGKRAWTYHNLEDATRRYENL